MNVGDIIIKFTYRTYEINQQHTHQRSSSAKDYLKEKYLTQNNSEIDGGFALCLSLFTFSEDEMQLTKQIIVDDNYISSQHMENVYINYHL